MKTNLASLKADHAGSSNTISHLEATIRDKDKHIEILQGQRQRSGEETDEELGRVKRAHEKLEGRLASLREQLSDKEVHEYMLYLYVVLLPGSIVIVLPYSSSGPRGGGGFSFTCIWPIRGCAARHGTIFVLFIRNRVYNFAQVCPKRCTCPFS